jgi:hypothetical protein
LQEELMQYKVANVYEEQIHKAKLILNKYEVLTREYQNQNKSLKENHERIIASERQKRQDIISNFENHLSQIKQQIKEDTQKFEEGGGNDVVKENELLRTQYESLIKEVEEKGKLMEEQIEQKEKANGTIE